MKVITKTVTTEYIEFDDGVMIEKQNFIFQLNGMSYRERAIFDLNDPKDANIWLFIKERYETLENKDKIIKDIHSQQIDKLVNRVIVTWEQGDAKNAFFETLAAEIENMAQ